MLLVDAEQPRNTVLTPKTPVALCFLAVRRLEEIQQDLIHADFKQAPTFKNTL
jgi:hypothetical protein